MAFLRVAARGFGRFMDQRRTEAVSRLQRRLGEQRRLLSNGTDATTEGNNHMRKALMEDRFRLEVDRQVVRDSWEKLVLIRGKEPLSEKQQWVKDCVTFLLPKSADELFRFVTLGSAFVIVFAESMGKERKEGATSFFDSLKATVTERFGLSPPTPPSHETKRFGLSPPTPPSQQTKKEA